MTEMFFGPVDDKRHILQYTVLRMEESLGVELSLVDNRLSDSFDITIERDGARARVRIKVNPDDIGQDPSSHRSTVAHLMGVTVVLLEDNGEETSRQFHGKLSINAEVTALGQPAGRLWLYMQPPPREE